MKKLINICLLLSAGLWSVPSFAQNDADPMLASAGFAASPLQVGSTTTLAIKFINFGYTTTLAANSISILVDFGATNAYQPSAPNTSIISGDFASNFNWVYNATLRTYTGTLNANVAPGDGGFINFQVTGTQATSGAYAIIPIAILPINPSQYPAEDELNNELTSGIQVTPSTPLNVKLESFTGVNEQCNAKLSWTTAFEQDNDRFEIEASNDGKTYANVGVVKAALNKAAKQSYSFNYTMQEGKMYLFRLKMVDNKGQSAYSTSVRLGCNVGAVVSVGPNPVTSMAHVSGLTDGKNSISIQDMKGRTLKTITAAHATADIDFSSYPAGVYYLRIISDNGLVTTHKMVKQ